MARQQPVGFVLQAAVILLVLAAVMTSAQAPGATSCAGRTRRGTVRAAGLRGRDEASSRRANWPSTMANPYRMVEKWPTFGTIRSGAAIGIIPDGKGGTWLHHRSEPPIIHFDASGKILKTFGDKMFVQAHGFCQRSRRQLLGGRQRPVRR